MTTNWEDMPLESWDGVLRAMFPIGWSPTRGTQTGETKDTSKYSEEVMSVVLKMTSTLVCPKSK